MNKRERIYAVCVYFGWIPWILGVIFLDINAPHRAFVRQHINQALIINLCGLLFVAMTYSHIHPVAVCGEALASVGLIFCAFGIIRAIKGSSEPLPLIGKIQLL